MSPSAPGSVTTPTVSPYRFFEVNVARVTSLGSTFVRITFSGRDLDRFADVGTDQRIKIVVPLPVHGIEHLPMGSSSWYDDWRALPEAHRNPLRTYTVRAVRPDLGEVDVDVVRHPGGLASDWLVNAEIGARTAILGPNADHPGPYGGQTWNPPGPGAPVLVVGDETALPAIMNICTVLPHGAVGEVVLEVPDVADFQPLSVPPGVRVSWLARGGKPYGQGIRNAVANALPRLCQGSARSNRVVEEPAPVSPVRPDLDDDEILWEIPDAADVSGATSRRLYVWVAAETSTVRELRQQFLTAGARRSDLSLMGYWRRGRSEN